MQLSASPAASPLLSFNPPHVDIEPAAIVARRGCAWPGLHVETVAASGQAPFKCRFHASWHLLMAAERAERSAGESLIEGLPKSSRRTFTGRLTFVPAGRRFHGWAMPRVPMQVTCFYIDPDGPLFEREALGRAALKPRLFFKDSDIWRAAARLKGACCAGPAQDGETLGALLAHEIVRSSEAPRVSILRGGLSGWQQRTVADHIEANLSEALRLTELAQLVRLSPYHFARAFKQSFGVPPHRYHVARRIERAKGLLADPSNSVTGIARSLGFAETSSFSATFRRVTGASPSDFRRDRN
ncbi:MAG TPA: AraC family transcriptional regulator [Pseudolabrys sp.]|jgi:AraC family transcriptional regulator|nr:AraC family transcriptional regulator [Pseudolabrys sp.]